MVQAALAEAQVKPAATIALLLGVFFVLWVVELVILLLTSSWKEREK